MKNKKGPSDKLLAQALEHLHQALTIQELAVAMKCSRDYAGRMVRELRDRREIYIHHWIRQEFQRGTYPRPVFKAGSLQDVAKPDCWCLIDKPAPKSAPVTHIRRDIAASWF